MKVNGNSVKKKRKQNLFLIFVISLILLVCVCLEAEKKKQNDKVSIIKNTKVAKKLDVPSIPKNKEKNICILLTDNTFKHVYHSTIKVTSVKPFIVTFNGKKKKYKANSVATFTENTKKLKNKTISCSSLGDAKLKILSIRRQNIHPSYRGKLQISWRKKGLLLKNILPLEEYLYAVVPSEMSTENKLEALKAQAVCARSFAYNQLKSKRYQYYKADLLDSVACQVYNNVPEDERSKKAVDDTRGIVLKKNGKVALAYYYATSWGCSASGKDVWDTNKPISYLKDKLQTENDNLAGTIDLSNESKFERFINHCSYKTYDSKSDWYRWSVTLPQKKLSIRIENALWSCYQNDSDSILRQLPSGKYAKKPFASIGKIKKIRIEKREKSGLVTELVIVGKKGVVKVRTQYNIRKVLAPLYEKISFGKNKKAKLSLLPSAAFYLFDEKKDGKKVFKIIGGGFGHGAGMSQTGASRMAELGKNYEDILRYYFDGIQVCDLDAK